MRVASKRRLCCTSPGSPWAVCVSFLLLDFARCSTRHGGVPVSSDTSPLYFPAARREETTPQTATIKSEISLYLKPLGSVPFIIRWETSTQSLLAGYVLYLVGVDFISISNSFYYLFLLKKIWNGNKNYHHCLIVFAMHSSLIHYRQFFLHSFIPKYIKIPNHINNLQSGQH